MSGYIHKPNSGSLFPNSRKDEDTHPDITGNMYLDKSFMQERMQATPDGELVQIAISGWNNAGGRIGLKFKKPYVKPTDQKTQAAEPKPAPAPAPEDDDSEIPF